MSFWRLACRDRRSLVMTTSSAFLKAAADFDPSAEFCPNLFIPEFRMLHPDSRLGYLAGVIKQFGSRAKLLRERLPPGRFNVHHPQGF